MGCSHGWSVGAAERPDAEPVENRHIIPFSPRRGDGLARGVNKWAIRGARSEDAPWHSACAMKLPPPLRGGWVEVRMSPRVALRPLGSGRSSTRGYTPPPLRGECLVGEPSQPEP